MRHIPEEELHAYLDQALSRSQCVEIESHLANCFGCSATRDGIAALRDRTTALLAQLAPPRRIPPAFEEVAALAAARSSRRRTEVRAAIWAASIAAALAIGYTASDLLHRPTAPAPVAIGPASRPLRAADVAEPSLTPLPDTPAARRTEPAQTRAPERFAPAHTAAARQHDSVAPPALGLARTDSASTAAASWFSNRPSQLTSQGLAAVDRMPEFGGMWRTVSWENARKESGEEPVRLDGLPVVQVQMQQGREGKQAIMVVAQQLGSGEMIRTIEGPIADVSELLARRGPPAPAPASLTPNSGIPVDDGVMAMTRGDRMLAVAARLPSDSLRAMVRRLNAELRSR